MLAKQWGVPRNGCQLVLLTDSKASIDIMNSISKGVAISGMVQPEMDVGLELNQLREIQPWIHRSVVKKESHIDREDAPNEFFWYCNDLADTLATGARDKFQVRELATREQFVFKGTKVCCKLEGRLVNNNPLSNIM